MKTARKFLLLTVLLAVLLTLLFTIPEKFDVLRMILGGLSLIVLVVFMVVVWKWRRNLNPEEKKELETIEV